VHLRDARGGSERARGLHGRAARVPDRLPPWQRRLPGRAHAAAGGAQSRAGRSGSGELGSRRDLDVRPPVAPPDELRAVFGDGVSAAECEPLAHGPPAQTGGLRRVRAGGASPSSSSFVTTRRVTRAVRPRRRRSIRTTGGASRWPSPCLAGGPPARSLRPKLHGRRRMARFPGAANGHPETEMAAARDVSAAVPESRLRSRARAIADRG
jgi:hypothetical protein